jgi:hypothetical protein
MTKFITAPLLFLLLLCSCEETNLPPQQSTIVVEGWIENGFPPVVILTKPIVITNEFQSYDDLYDYVVRWAKVSVVCENDTVVLTGKYSSDYIPNYIYTTGKMIGEVGKTYKLIVEYDTHRATAETTILPPPQIANCEVSPVQGSDRFYQIELMLKDLAPSRNYYQCFYKLGRDSKQYFSTYLGTFNDNVLDYEQPIKIFKGRNFLTDGKDFSTYFVANEYVSVKVAHIDEEAYNFWDAYSQNVELSYNMFLYNATSIPTNITGGYGYWCGMGSSRVYSVIGEYIIG